MELAVIRSALLLVLLALAGPALAAPVPSFTPRKIQGSTCVAPCAVHFDAIGDGTDETTDAGFTRPFHSLRYFWNFGDAGAGDWQIGSLFEGGITDSKNEDQEAVAFHVYEDADVYTVRLTVINPLGEAEDITHSVTVVDPDSHFSASNTYCFRNGGTNDYIGCPLDTTPGGACEVSAGNCQNLSSFSSIVTAAGAGAAMKRIMLRGGDTFTGGISGSSFFGSDTSPGLIESFGTGKATISGTGSFETDIGWTVHNVILNGLAIKNGSFGSENAHEHMTFYKVDVSIPFSGAGAASRPCFDLGSPFDRDLEHHLYMAVIGGVFTCDPENWIAGKYFIFAGNDIDFAGRAATCGDCGHYYFRHQQHQHMIYSRNKLHGFPEIGHAPVLFRNGDEEFGDNSVEEESSMFNVVHRNVWDWGLNKNYVKLRLCPDSGCNCTETGTNNCGSQGCGGGVPSGETVAVHDWRFNANMHRFLTPAVAADQFTIYDLWGSDHTVTNEIIKFDGGLAPSDSMVYVGAGGNSPGRTDSDFAGTCTGEAETEGNVLVFGNTAFTTSSYTGTFTFCGTSTGVGWTGCPSGLCLCYNNLLVATGGSASPTIGNHGQFTELGQIAVAASDPFDGTMPGEGGGGPGDFMPSVGASTVVNAGRDFNAGTDLSFWHGTDARGLCRPDASEWDRGAIERNAEACGVAVEPPAPKRGSPGGSFNISRLFEPLRRAYALTRMTSAEIERARARLAHPQSSLRKGLR